MKQTYTLLSIVIFFLFPNALSASTDSNIKGVVIGMPADKPLSAAVVQLYGPDSLLIQTVSTNRDGHFVFSTNKKATSLRIKALGYHISNVSLYDVNNKLKLPDTLRVYSLSVRLEDVLVTSELPPVVVKGDTVEYNTGAYQPGETDLLKDLVKRIVGMKIDNSGKITINGEEINKIMIDGEEYFGGKILLALENLPVRMIKKLQLYRKEPEETKITGIKSEQADQVLNLVVKEELKNSWFGNLMAGYGSRNAHRLHANANRVRGKEQLSVLGNYDYLPMGGAKLGTTYSVGVNTSSNKWEKIRYSASLNVGGNKDRSESSVNAYTFAVDRYESNQSRRKTKMKHVNGDLMLEIKPDTLTSMTITSRLNYSDSDNEFLSGQESFVTDKDTTRGYTLNNAENNTLNWSNMLWFARRLGQEKRSVSFHASMNMQRTDGDGMYYSQTIYPHQLPIATIDQRRKNDAERDGYYLSASYNEPVSERGVLSLSYSVNINNSRLEADIRKKDADGAYIVVDSAYARSTRNKSINHTARLSYREWGDTYNFSIGFGVLPSFSQTRIHMLDSLVDDIKQKVVNFSPYIYYSYRPSKDMSLDFNYSGQTVRPTVHQLSTDTIIHNALSKSYGNPYLKPGFRGAFTLFFRTSDFDRSRFFSASIQINHMQNIVSPYVFVDSLANRVSTYRNVNGNWGMVFGSTYSSPLKNKNFTLDGYTNINYQSRLGYTNARKSSTHDWAFTQQIAGRFATPDNRVNTYLRLGGSYRILRNSLLLDGQRNIFDGTVSHQIEWKLPFDFVLKNTVQYSFYLGYEEGVAENECIWDLELAKHVMKDKRGTIAITLHDILDDRNNFRRTISTEQVSDISSHTLNRYLLVSFTYRI